FARDQYEGGNGERPLTKSDDGNEQQLLFSALRIPGLVASDPKHHKKREKKKREAVQKAGE
ncbi:unnamed protein product, partial [Heterosigma akashiwo]